MAQEEQTIHHLTPAGWVVADEDAPRPVDAVITMSYREPQTFYATPYFSLDWVADDDARVDELVEQHGMNGMKRLDFNLALRMRRAERT